jgi:hypothetical protein
MKRLIISSLILLYMAVPTVQTSAQITQPAYWQVIIGEAADQGYTGMYAVACVIKNRGGGLNGFSAANRKDLSVFCDRQGREIMRQARAIERKVFQEHGPDITKGATLFENIEKYGFPKTWDKSKVIKTVKIKSHTFFREKSLRGREEVSRQAHNLKIAGASPAPATTLSSGK